MNMLITIAKPNPKYRWYNTTKFILQVHYNNGRVYYYEVSDDRPPKLLREETVKALFAEGKRIKDRPFMKTGNTDFYCVLYRHRKRYQPIFKKLISKPLKRTKS